MDCREVQVKLGALLDGALGADSTAEVERHLAECPVCGAGDLARGVLARTSGPACPAALERLPDWVDGTLEPVERVLIEGHLAHCGECAGVARAMRALGADLRALVPDEVDPDFVDDVVAATLPARPSSQPAAPGLADLAARLLARPRIAWEGAFVATAILAFVFGLPGSPVGRVPGRALELIRTDPVEALREPAGSAWRSTGQPVVEAYVATARGLWRSAGEDLGTIWTGASSSEGEKEKETTP